MTIQEAVDNARRRYRVALDLLKDERRKLAEAEALVTACRQNIGVLEVARDLAEDAYTAALNADGFMTQAAR